VIVSITLTFAQPIMGELATTPDAAPVPRDAPDGGPTETTDGLPDEDANLADLREEVEVLGRILEQRERGEADITDLLGVDLLDEPAVGRRATELRRSIASTEAALAELREHEPSPEELDGGLDGGPDADLDGAESDAELDGEVDDEPPEDAARRERLELVLERDRLGLQILSLSASERMDIVGAAPEQQRVIAELQAAAAAQQEAEEAARVAEEARQDALDTVRSAEAEGARMLAGERARVEEARAEIARSRHEYANRRELLARLTQDHLDLVADVSESLADSSLTEEGAEELYGRVVDDLTEARDEFADALDDLDAPSVYEPHRLQLDIEAEIYRRFPGERGSLRRSLRQMEAEGRVLQDEEEDLRWTRAEALADAVTRLNNVRFDLLPRLSRAERERVLGLGTVGRAQLERELYHLQLVARWQLERLPRTLRETLTATGDVLSRSSPRLVVIELLLVAILAVIALLRRQRPWTALRELISRRMQGGRDAAAVDRWLGALEVVGFPLTMLILTWIGFGLLGQLTESRSVALARTVLLSYAWYRLLLAAAHHFFVSAAVTARRTVSKRISKKILRTIQVIGLYVLLVYIFLVVSSHLLGRGYLFTLVVEFAWVGAFPIAYFFMRYWKKDIFDVYLKVSSEGTLAGLVSRRRDKVFGVLLLIPAFLALAVRAVVVYVREAALRFDRTRRALAYLFRRQLQQQAEALGTTGQAGVGLPSELEQTFQTDPAPDEALIDHYPHLESTLGFIQRWRGGEWGTAFALVGERGVGKTTWLRQLERRCEEDATIFTALEDTLVTEESICRSLSGILGAQEVDTIDEVIEIIDSGPRRLFLLDHCQNLVLRSVGGMSGLNHFSRIVSRTIRNHFWVCSFSRYAWEHVEFALRDQNVFHHVSMLDGWDEKDLAELIEKRMDLCGAIARFDELAGSRGRGPVPKEELARTRERYYRLLWDYTNGLPEVAMYYWQRSLIPGYEGALRVALFDAPDTEELEGLQEQARFALLAVVSHENLTVEEATQVLAYSPGQCLALLEMLRSRGYLMRTGDRYRVTLRWWSEVIRFLRRKHLLYS